MFALVTALADGDEQNPWPGGIADTTWWFSLECAKLGGASAGIYADKPGFHNTVAHNQQNWPTNYSINPAYPVLLAGPRDKARAFDWMFPEAQTKNYVRINLYCQRLMDASLAHDPRLNGLYEWFGTKDGTNIGYSVLRDRFSSSDDTHDWHIHFSFITAYLLIWAAVHGVMSVLHGETLQAYLARGGQLINKENGTIMSEADILQKISDVAVPGGSSMGRKVPFKREDGTLIGNFNGLAPKLDHVMGQGDDTTARLTALATAVINVQNGLVELATTISTIGQALAAINDRLTTPVPVAITDEQVDRLAGNISESLLSVEADADEARAHVLREAAGS